MTFSPKPQVIFSSYRFYEMTVLFSKLMSFGVFIYLFIFTWVYLLGYQIRGTKLTVWVRNLYISVKVKFLLFFPLILFQVWNFFVRVCFLVKVISAVKKIEITWAVFVNLSNWHYFLINFLFCELRTSTQSNQLYLFI